MEGPHEDLRGYLAAVDELQTNVEFFTRNGNFESSGSVLNHAQNLLAKAMIRLEEEFKRLLRAQRCFRICLCIIYHLYLHQKNSFEDKSGV